MEGLVVRSPFVSTGKKLPFSPLLDSLPSCSASGSVFAKAVSKSRNHLLNYLSFFIIFSFGFDFVNFQTLSVCIISRVVTHCWVKLIV